MAIRSCLYILEGDRERYRKAASVRSVLGKCEILDWLQTFAKIVPYSINKLANNDIVLWNTGDGTFHISVYNDNKFWMCNQNKEKTFIRLRPSWSGSVAPVFIVKGV